MKKVFLSIFTALLICFFMTTSIFAEENTIFSTDTTLDQTVESVVETAPPLTEVETTLHTEAETNTWSGALVAFLKDNFTETSLTAFGLGLFTFCLEYLLNNKKLKKHIGILNGNAIEIAKSSADNSRENNQLLNSMIGRTEVTLSAITKTAEERDKLEATLNEANALMKGVIIAASTNSELLANLLLMSKIPNSKKEEMYATYLEADKALKGVQQVDLKGEEVMENE